eukprot:357902-Chlamydomonas_euryale.AAC.19
MHCEDILVAGMQRNRCDTPRLWCLARGTHTHKQIWVHPPAALPDEHLLPCCFQGHSVVGPVVVLPPTEGVTHTRSCSAPLNVTHLDMLSGSISPTLDFDERSAPAWYDDPVVIDAMP